MAEIVPPCVETDAWESFVAAMNRVCVRRARGLYLVDLRNAHLDPEWLASIEADKAERHMRDLLWRPWLLYAAHREAVPRRSERKHELHELRLPSVLQNLAESWNRLRDELQREPTDKEAFARFCEDARAYEWKKHRVGSLRTYQRRKADALRSGVLAPAIS